MRQKNINKEIFLYKKDEEMMGFENPSRSIFINQ